MTSSPQRHPRRPSRRQLKPTLARLLFALLPVTAAVTAVLTVACSSIDCPVQNAVYTVYNIYGSDGTPITLGDTLTVTTTCSDGNDSVLLNRLTGASTFNLPISYNAPEDTLIFYVSGEGWEVSDSVLVAKDNYPHFESVDCNISFFHNIRGVRWTRNIIDSIAVNNQMVNYDLSKEHFHIYFRTRR